MTPDPDIKVRIETSTKESLLLRAPEIREVKKLFSTALEDGKVNLCCGCHITPH